MQVARQAKESVRLSVRPSTFQSVRHPALIVFRRSSGGAAASLAALVLRRRLGGRRTTFRGGRTCCGELLPFSMGWQAGSAFPARPLQSLSWPAAQVAGVSAPPLRQTVTSAAAPSTPRIRTTRLAAA